MPQLNISVKVLKHFEMSSEFRGSDVNILCGPPYLCEAAQAAGIDARTNLIGGHGLGNQGHHLKHLVWAFAVKGSTLAAWDAFHKETGGTESAQFVYGYLGSQYNLADAYRISLGSEVPPARYVLLISRERMRSRKLPAATRVALVDELTKTLAKDEFGTELRVFVDPDGLANDSALYYGARAVIGLHGGALSNTVFCKRGTPVVEVLPSYNPRLMFAAIASAKGLKHYTFNPDHWTHPGSYYSDKPIEVDARELHDFVARVLSIEGVIRLPQVAGR